MQAMGCRWGQAVCEMLPLSSESRSFDFSVSSGRMAEVMMPIGDSVF